MRVEGHLTIPVKRASNGRLIRNGVPRWSVGYPGIVEGHAAVVALALEVPDSAFVGIPAEVVLDEADVDVLVEVTDPDPEPAEPRP